MLEEVSGWPTRDLVLRLSYRLPRLDDDYPPRLYLGVIVSSDGVVAGLRPPDRVGHYPN